MVKLLFVNSRVNVVVRDTSTVNVQEANRHHSPTQEQSQARERLSNTIERIFFLRGSLSFSNASNPRTWFTASNTTFRFTACTLDLADLSTFLLFSNLTSYLSDSNVCSIGDFHGHVIERSLLCIQRLGNDNRPDTFLCVKRAVKIPPWWFHRNNMKLAYLRNHYRCWAQSLQGILTLKYFWQAFLWLSLYILNGASLFLT